MKNAVKFFAMLMVGTLLLASCNKSDIPGFKKTKSGLHYKFETTNSSGDPLHMGEVLVGELTLRMDDSVFYTNVGNPGRILTITDSVFRNGNIGEGLLMMHKGEKAIFAIFADSLFRFYSDEQMPLNYKHGSGQILYWEVSVNDVVTPEELAQERENFFEQMEQRQKDEPAAIRKYVADNNIKVAPNADGLYVIVKKMGKGNKVAMGREVAMDYTGRLLDGTVFDSSVERIGQAAGLNRPHYEPISYTVGRMSLIKGWEMGIDGMPEGSELTLIIPSRLGYGPQGAGQMIEPYTPLVFDINILSVK